MFPTYRHGLKTIDARICNFMQKQTFNPIRHFHFISGITISDTSTTLPNGAKEAWKIPVLIWQLMFAIGSDGYCIPNSNVLLSEELGIEDELICNPTEVILQTLASTIELYIVLKKHTIWYSETFTLDYLFSVFKFHYLRLLKLGKLFDGCQKLTNKQKLVYNDRKYWVPAYKYNQVHEDEKSVLGIHMGEFKRYGC